MRLKARVSNAAVASSKVPLNKEETSEHIHTILDSPGMRQSLCKAHLAELVGDSPGAAPLSAPAPPCATLTASTA